MDLQQLKFMLFRISCLFFLTCWAYWLDRQSLDFFKIVFCNFREYIISVSIVRQFCDFVLQFISVAIFCSIVCLSSFVWIFRASVSFIPDYIDCVSVRIHSKITSIKNSVFSIICSIFRCWAEVSIDCISFFKNLINLVRIFVDSIICNSSQISVFFIPPFANKVNSWFHISSLSSDSSILIW